MDNHEEETGGMKYPHNALEGFSNGCLMDLRMRFAMEVLKGGIIASGEPTTDARYAIALAGATFDCAEELGWVSPLPDNGELNRALRMQARRSAKFQAAQQREGQVAMQNETSGVVIEPAGQH